MTLGKRIREYRNRLGYTQEKIAEITGTSRQAVTKWEADKSIPCMENLITLSEIFGVPLEELSSGVKKESAEVIPTVPTKRFFGGIFVLIHFFVCLFYCFWHLIIKSEPYIGGIIASWVLWLCSITVYVFFTLAAKSGDFTMIAGYDPKMKYNKETFSKLLAFVSVSNGFTAMFYSALYFITPFLDDTIRTLYNLVLIFGYAITLVVSMLFGNNRFKGQLTIED